MQQGQTSTLISRVEGFYSWQDVLIVAIAAIVLGLSGAVMLQSLSSRAEQVPGIVATPAWKAVYEQKKSTWEEAVKTLKDDEAALFRAIMNAEGMANQRELVTVTGLPKSTVSKCLDILENRGLVERRRRGMGNVILLK